MISKSTTIKYLGRIKEYHKNKSRLLVNKITTSRRSYKKISAKSISSQYQNQNNNKIRFLLKVYLSTR